MSLIKKLFLFVLIFSGLFYSVNLSSFIYQNESLNNITYQNFTKNNNSYSLVLISSNPTFLLVNGELSVNQTEIRTTVKEYYLNNFYPSASELDNLKSLIDRFNKSRNDGIANSSFANKEEYICRNEVLASNGRVTVLGEPLVCRDQASCQRISQMLFGVWNEAGLRLGSPTVIYNSLIDFTPNSLALDSLLSNFTSRLANSNEANIYDNVEYIRANSDSILTYADKIEKTLFRTPKPNDPVDRAACIGKCYGLCPSIDLDQSIVPQIKSAAANLSAKTRFLQNSDSYSTRVFSETISRISFNNNETAAKQYLAAFISINSTASSVLSESAWLTSRVSDPVLESSYSRFRALSLEIPSQIQNRNFTQIDSKISEFQSLASDLSDLNAQLRSSYESAENASILANKQVLLLQSKDLDPSTSESLDSLRSRLYNLNSVFSSKISTTSLLSFESNYSEIYNQSLAILESDNEVPASKATNLLRSLSKKTNYGISDSLSYLQIKDMNFDYLFAGISLLVFLGLSSLFGLVFFYGVLSLRHFSPQMKRVMVFVFIAVMVGILFFSTTSFQFFKKTSTDSNVAEYLDDLDSHSRVLIVADQKDVPVEFTSSINSCAASLGSALSSLNKSVSTYILKSDSCLVISDTSNSTLSLLECQNAIKASSSSIHLHYSDQPLPPIPTFSSIYNNQANFFGNQQYFNSCHPLTLYS